MTLLTPTLPFAVSNGGLIVGFGYNHAGDAQRGCCRPGSSAPSMIHSVLKERPPSTLTSGGYPPEARPTPWLKPGGIERMKSRSDPLAAPARHRRGDEHLCTVGDRRLHGSAPSHAHPVDEHEHVRPEPALLVAQPALQLRVSLGQIVERGTEGAAADLNLGLFAGVASQRSGQKQPRGHATSATRTESTSGRCSAIIDQLSPSSRLAYTSPSLVPK